MVSVSSIIVLLVHGIVSSLCNSTVSSWYLSPLFVVVLLVPGIWVVGGREMMGTITKR